jgi:hypothetical protein
MVSVGLVILVSAFVAVRTVIVGVGVPGVVVVLALPAVTVFMVGVTVSGRGLVLVMSVFVCLFRLRGALAEPTVACMFG